MLDRPDAVCGAGALLTSPAPTSHSALVPFGDLNEQPSGRYPAFLFGKGISFPEENPHDLFRCSLPLVNNGEPFQRCMLTFCSARFEMFSGIFFLRTVDQFHPSFIKYLLHRSYLQAT